MKDIKIDKFQWNNDNDMLRVKVPTNGKIQDTIITLNDEIIQTDEQASFSLDRNDLLIPLKRSLKVTDIEPMVKAIKEEFKNLVVEIEDVYNQDNDSRNKRTKRMCWSIILAGIVIAVSVHWEKIINLVSNHGGL